MKRLLLAAALALTARAASAQINTALWRQMVLRHDAVLESYGMDEGGDLAVAGELSLGDSVWDDLTLSALQLRDPPGVEAAPALQAYSPGGGITNYVLDFDTGERAFGILQMKHGYKRDSEVRPHIHWTAAVACTSTWELAMSFGRIGGGMTNLYLETAVFTNSVPWGHVMSSFPAATDMTNKLGESGIFLVTLKCVAEGAATTDGPYLMDFDIHYQLDKLGSDNENPYE